MKTSWRKWKLGFAIAVLFALLSAGSGLVGDMGWKSFVAVLCTAMMTNLGAYLMKHPVDDISDTNTALFTNPAPQKPTP